MVKKLPSVEMIIIKSIGEAYCKCSIANIDGTYVYRRYVQLETFKIINNQIIKEQACIDDLIKEISIHTQNDRYQLAAERGRDMQNLII